MRLSDFIEWDLEKILRGWESFARTVDTPADDLDNKRLRNHAVQVLQAIAKDMRSPQSEAQQIRKSEGLAPDVAGETAAQKHALERHRDGFTLDQMVSEYRALRSSVLRLWLKAERDGESYHVDDIVRFNEAIDQALTESISSFGRAVEATRKTVLGVLGHDLRSPLTSIVMGADLLRKSGHLPDRERDIAEQMASSARRSNRLIADLVDFARCNLGPGIPVLKEVTELASICKAVISELRAGEPDAHIVFTAPERVVGHFDPERVAQVFTNLIGNAVRHGDLSEPIEVSLALDGAAVQFEVRNSGHPIDPDFIPHLFSPERRYMSAERKGEAHAVGLGLGLFIASEIVAKHDGRIDVESSSELGTRFLVTMSATGDTPS